MNTDSALQPIGGEKLEYGLTPRQPADSTDQTRVLRETQSL
jgi:hypothetical protein